MSDNPSPVRVVMNGPAWLVLEMDLERIAPADALQWFIEPELLAQWWGEECTIEPVPGGRYEVHWPGMTWTMRGHVLLCHDNLLIYSWTWDHEPDLPARTVIVRTEPSADGTRLTISHGPYRPTSSSLTREDEDRESHRDGWLFFLPKLREAIATSL